jgi:hypothetical protein
MDSIPGYIEIRHGEADSVCRIILDREVSQPIKYVPDGSSRFLTKKLYENYDISLLVGHIFGKEVLETGEVIEGGEVSRGRYAASSWNNSLTTINLRAGDGILKVEFETPSPSSHEWDLPSVDMNGRRAITITAKKEIIDRMTGHHEFMDICDHLVCWEAAKYKPKTYEFRLDLGRPVFQPLAGSVINEAAAQGDVAILVGRIFGERVFNNLETSTEKPRRTRTVVVKGAAPVHMGVEIKAPLPDKVVEMQQLSQWNIARLFTFKVDGGSVTACFETAFHAEPNPLPCENDAAARNVITVKGPKHLVEKVSGFAGLEALCAELKARDIAKIRSSVAAATIAPIPAPKPQRSNGPRFPRRTDGFGVDNRRPSFGSNGISVPARFRDERQGGFHDGGRSRFSRDSLEVMQIARDGTASRDGPGSMRRYHERKRRDNERPFGAPRERDGFMRPPPHMRGEPEKPKPPANKAEAVARLTMKQAAPGHDRMGRKTGWRPR